MAIILRLTAVVALFANISVCIFFWQHSAIGTFSHAAMSASWWGLRFLPQRKEENLWQIWAWVTVTCSHCVRSIVTRFLWRSKYFVSFIFMWNLNKPSDGVVSCCITTWMSSRRFQTPAGGPPYIPPSPFFSSASNSAYFHFVYWQPTPAVSVFNNLDIRIGHIPFHSNHCLSSHFPSGVSNRINLRMWSLLYP